MNAPDTEGLRIDVHSLRYFEALVREGTMRKAANSLRITQPTFSRQIANLELNVGKTLFERRAGRLHLTPDGEILHRYAQKILGLVAEAETELASGKRTVSGRVAVGCAETASLEVIARCVRKVRELHPNVVVDLITGSPLEMFERLDAGMMDFLLEVEGIKHAGYDRLLMPIENPWVLVVPKDNELARLDKITPEDLAGHVVVCSRLVLKSGILARWAEECLEDIEVGATFNLGTYLITVLAANGVGCCLTYEGLHGLIGDPRVVALPLDPPIPVDRTIVTWKRSRPLSPAAAALLECLREECREA